MYKLAVRFFSRSAKGSRAAACQRTGLLHQRGSMWSLFTKTPERTFSMAKIMSLCNRYISLTHSNFAVFVPSSSGVVSVPPQSHSPDT